MDRDTILLLISTPIYVLVIGGEMIFSFVTEKRYYTTKGFFANLYLTTLNFLLDASVKLLGGWFIMTYFYDLGGFKLNLTWSPVWYWIVLTLFEDMMYYWEHRFDHYVRFFWAMHVTHHSSNEYNLSVGFRSSVFQPLYRIAYFLPIAFLGFRAEDIMFTYAWTQILGVLVHTQTVGKMWAPIEWLFATPSHHRVHHACNVRYLDKNMGMLLIIWDRLFGTFAKEDPNYEPIRYGLTTPLQTYHPLKLVFHEWVNIKNDLKKSKKLKDRWMYLFGPPGWSHDGSTHTSAQLRAKEAKG